jgi:pimeloyl-ACP methyl ester carboxylesterase
MPRHTDTTDGKSRWKSTRAEEKFRSLYAEATADACAEQERAGHLPVHTTDVSSRYGTTRCLHRGGSGEPLVLLHGQMGSWLGWTPLLAELAGRDVYALDTVGDPGGSSQTAPIESVDDLVSWLEDVLDELALDHPVLAGMSYGGWIAAQFAARHSPRLSSLILLEPAIGEITKGRVLRQGMKVASAQLLPPPLKRRTARSIDAEPLVMDPRVRRTPALAFRRFDRRLPVYARLDDPTPDATLAAIAIPTLLVLGGRSELHDITKVADKAQRLVNDLELHVIDGASHALPVTRPEQVAALMTPFLARHARAGRPSGQAPT